jgi:hypothetical protein
MNRPRFVQSACVLVTSLALVASCSNSSSGISNFTSQQTGQALDVTFDAVVGGDWAAYRALEATTGAAGTDLDGDTTTDDAVTMALSLASGAEYSSNLNADAVYIIDNVLFLVVDETIAGVDLGGNVGATDLLLMTWEPADGVFPVALDTLDPAATIPAVATSDRLYYIADATPGAMETNVRFVDTSDLLTTMTVGHTAGTLTSGRLMGAREDLVLLRFDETVDGDLDGDADGTDLFVLALLDGTDVAAEVVETAVTMGSAVAPFDAEALDTQGWLVGVLADEASMGMDLNDPALFAAGWRPGQCAAGADGDMTDDVLFYIYFDHATFASTPINTGLVGRNRVHVVGGEYVATISPETEAGCDLNQDGGTGDLIPRWCAAVDPAMGSMGIFPPTATSVMDAIVASPAGDSFGLVKMQDILVALVDEATDDQDHNGDTLKNATLIAYIDDLDTDLAWEYDLDDPEGGTAIVGASWMSADAQLNRIGIALEESSVGMSLNNGCGTSPKDMDLSDSVAGWLHYESGGLVIAGIGFSTQPFNAGASFAGGQAWFNVDENSDDFDYNGDGDKNDQILVRNPLGSIGCVPKAMGTMSSMAGLALIGSSPRGAVFIADEVDAKFDFNTDGDKLDEVLRWTKFF